MRDLRYIGLILIYLLVQQTIIRRQPLSGDDIPPTDRTANANQINDDHHMRVCVFGFSCLLCVSSLSIDVYHLKYTHNVIQSSFFTDWTLNSIYQLIKYIYNTT